MSRMKKQPTTLTLPPFPLLTWDGHNWTGDIVLKSWQGFQTRLGPYGSESSELLSDGTVQIAVDPGEPPPMETSRKRPPTAKQATAFRVWLDNEDAIHDRIVQSIVDFYNATVDEYLDAGRTDLPTSLHDADGFRDLIGLSIVHVLNREKDGVPYIGCEFGCEWDGEHGLGVMTHNGDVVAIGEADTAFCPPC